MLEEVTYKDLKGKHALVTGGAQGIGKAITERLISNFVRVSMFDINTKAIENIKSKYDRANLQCYNVDISNTEQVNKIFKSGKIPTLDILVNNAGIGLNVDLENPDETAWNKVFNTNLNGSRYVTQNVLKQMKDNKRGSIIFITSVHTAQAFSNEAAYDSSKHALVGLMRVIATDYGQYGIRSNAVAPGAIIDAGRTKETTPKQEIELNKKIPLRRCGKSKEIANVVAFLASDQSSYINGAEIRVDGGLSIRNSLL